MTKVDSSSPRAVAATRHSSPPTVHLKLLGGFALACNGVSVSLPLAAQRLVAFLALQRLPRLRLHVACALWLDGSEKRSSASLRSVLWRINQHGRHVVDAGPTHIVLAPSVDVDVRTMVSRAKSLIAGRTDLDDVSSLDNEKVDLVDDLLPDWYDEWVVLERERLRQLRLHALEALALVLSDAGRYGEAIEAGQAAIQGEPLRETSHRIVIRVHLAEGNDAEALRQFRIYEQLAASELRIEPSPEIRSLIAHLTSL